MIRVTAFTVLALTVALAGASVESHAQLRPAADDAMPFQSIFDGKTLNGWVSYNTGKTPTNWAVEDGALVRTGGGGDIMTAEQYDNFELKVEWKISPKGNSGIMYRTKPNDGQPYFSAPEYQVLDDAGHNETDKSKTSSGALYGLIAAAGKTIKPVDEFNTARILVQGNHVEHWLNGKKVVEVELHSDHWNELVAGSKFKQWKQFGKSPMGHIDFQDHGQKVWYRNIMLRPLPPPDNGEQAFADITTGASHALIHERKASGELVVLDVRTQQEFDAGHLDGVEFINFYDKDFKQQLGELDKDLTYLVYCKVGGRSGKAVGMMKEMGFREAYNMMGGWDKWSKEKRPAAK